MSDRKSNPRKQRVKIIETGQVFESLTECAQFINGNPMGITHCLSGRRSHYKGFSFEKVGARSVGYRVRIIETGEVFESQTACADHIGGTRQGVSNCIAGRLSTHKGYTFERIESVVGSL